MEQRSKEWFAIRNGRVTGSAVGAILGLSPYQTAADVMRRMVRQHHGQDDEFKGNIATEYGVNNEPNAIADYQLQHNKVEECGFFISKNYEFMGASPDGLIGDDGLIEVKCPYSRRNDADFKPLSNQPHYHAQIQFQLWVTGRQWCDFYQWSTYGEMVERVLLDPVWLDQNIPKLLEFYERYLTERQPENAWRYLSGGDLVQTYKNALAEFNAANEKLDEAKEALIDAANGESCQIGDIKITKVEKKGSISYANAIKELAPDADLEAYRGKSSEYWKVT